MNELVKELSGKYSREHLLLINIPNIKVSLEGSTAKRIVFNGQIIRYNYLFNKINTITTVFKVTRDKTSAIYAFLFSEVNENKIDHKFVSTGPTFTSMDGEYRHKTIPMEKIYEIFEYYEKQLNIVEDLILEKLNNKVPKTMQELVELPGVGRKVANCVLVYAYKQDAIPVDTHVHRISNRLGWVKTKSPEETEKALESLVPKRHWQILNDTFVSHGKTICAPISPFCSKCPISAYCKKVNVKKHR